MPYCSYVELDDDAVIDDDRLLQTAERVEKLSRHFPEWHRAFGQRYFSDLSFLMASLAFGLTEAVRMKFVLVRDIVSTGDRARLERIVGEIPAIWKGLK